MSELRKEKYVCPHCQHESEVDIWNSINVDLDPELKEQIFNNEIWAWTCPKCGEKTYIPWGALYHDMTHKFMIFFAFDSEDVENKYTPLELPDGVFLDDYTVRAVYGLMNFKEKIRILEENLDDIAIEHMKYMISHLAHPEIVEKGYQLYFERVDYENNEDAEHGSIFFSYYDEKDNNTVPYRFSMDNYYEHCLTVKIDPRMGLNGCKCVDAEWIERQLKLAQ